MEWEEEWDERRLFPLKMSKLHQDKGYGNGKIKATSKLLKKGDRTGLGP